MHDFKELNVWKEAMDLVVDVYQVTEQFPTEEKYGLTSQIRRSAVSVPSNIAEGAYRNTNGEFKQFLGIANGSSGELYTQLVLAHRLGLAKIDELNPIIERLEINNRRVSKLIHSINK
jgi:four helix bundle protein